MDGRLFFVLFSAAWSVGVIWFWVTGRARIRGGGIVDRRTKPVLYTFVMIVFTIAGGVLIWASYHMVTETVLASRN